ncbi:hypothetical protein RB5544 [Rhodopirellula baltica SH 1]|uniref:Uncharacterized protein n=1 Tax=Rhodopirellula baltica (strain DSM 10527 / NCIMB 13988 / SH1) TaxID=243090 RepID=Q7URP2_RHOBA|nr:hypothetical protein RB5544 [Rhodopirellula baltica SH 1]
MHNENFHRGNFHWLSVSKGARRFSDGGRAALLRPSTRFAHPREGRAVLLHPTVGRGGPFRAGEGYSLDSMPSPPLALLDPPKGKVMIKAWQYNSFKNCTASSE